MHAGLEAESLASTRLPASRISQAWRLLLCLLAAALLIRLPFFFQQGYWYDALLFRRWAAGAYENGLPSVFSDPEIDYVGYTYLLWLIAAVVAPFISGPLAESRALLQAMKAPGILGDLLVITLLFWLTRRWLLAAPLLIGDRLRLWLSSLPLPGGHLVPVEERAALLAAGLYAFNVAVLYDTAYWGQNDSLVSFFMLAALGCLLERRWLLSWVLSGIGFLVKPQMIVLGPLLALLTLRSHGPRGLAKGLAVAALVLVAGVAYFVSQGLTERLSEVYNIIFLDHGTRVSVSAWNTWYPFQEYARAHPGDTLLALPGYALSYENVSRVLMVLAGGVFLAFMRKAQDPKAVLIAAAYLVFAFYMLPMKMHERYLFPFFALLAPVAVLERRWLFFYLALSLTFTLNLSAVLPIDRDIQKFLNLKIFSSAVSVLNLLLFLVYSALLLKPEIGSQSRRRRVGRVGLAHEDLARG